MKIPIYTSITLASLLCTTVQCVSGEGGFFAKELKLPMTILNMPQNKKKNIRYRTFWDSEDSEASNSGGVSFDGDNELHISINISINVDDSLDHELIKRSNTRNGAGSENRDRKFVITSTSSTNAEDNGRGDDDEDIYEETRRALRKENLRRARHGNSNTHRRSAYS